MKIYTNKQTDMNIVIKISLFLFVPVFFLVACNSNNKPADSEQDTDPKPAPFAALRLGSFSNCDEYKDYLIESFIKELTSIGVAAVDGIPETTGDAVTGGASGGAANSDSSTAPDEVSQTNVQELGVDEADLVKADSAGNLYIVHSHYLLIEQGFPPAELTELSRLDLKVHASELFLDEDGRRLVAFGQGINATTVGGAAMISPYYANTSVVFIDVSDHAKPVISKRWELQGYRVNSRRVSNRVHLILRHNMVLPEILQSDQTFWDLVWEYYSSGDESLLADIEQKIRTALADTDIQDYLPDWVTTENGQTNNTKLLTCADIQRPEVITYPGLTSVASFDLDGSNLATTAVSTSAALTYATEQHLYLSQNSGYWWWDDNQSLQTVIYKFLISNGQPEYVATGVIDGWVHDQFSFSEYQDYLRVTTSITQFGGTPQGENNLFVMQDNNEGTLDVVGEVRGFAPDESIFSTRFVGPRGYVVTFRRVDPLFAFDLSDPANPSLAGEVEIPGFSTYMHPIDDNHLLTIGRGGTETGALTTVQLQIFDVSDLANPKRLYQHELQASGYGWSPALYDHHAFTYFGQRNLLVIPFTQFDWNADQFFNGFVAFKVDTSNGISELGRVEHDDLAHEAFCTDIPPGDSYLVDFCQQKDYVYWASPRRSVIMTSSDSDYLYSISDVGVKASDISNLDSALGSVVFPDPGSGYWGVPVVSVDQPVATTVGF
jgi:uncharacterized secreted protein with C-terminal beta-propeller domain